MHAVNVRQQRTAVKPSLQHQHAVPGQREQVVPPCFNGQEQHVHEEDEKEELVGDGVVAQRKHGQQTCAKKLGFLASYVPH